VFTTTTLYDATITLTDRLYRRSRWLRRCLRRTRYAIEYAELGPCCTGWYFEHTDGCVTPDLPRGCSRCCVPPGTQHDHFCSWYWSAPFDLVDIDVSCCPDAARRPGHAGDGDSSEQGRGGIDPAAG
jgi:hypothetical protein